MHVTQREHIWYGQFQCMASPCEVLIETEDEKQARELIAQAEQEALRIEQKFSRYRDDNIIYRIHNSHGQAVSIDEETYRLLQFADNCYQLSEGLFDITSGVLRRLWNFNGSNQIPRQSQIDQILRHIGWERVKFSKSEITLPHNMQIDFGGIGKEYAVDRVLQLLMTQSDSSMMINFGGDCHANAPQKNGQPWITGIENPLKPGDAAEIIKLNHGALATSGDVYRYIQKGNIRYSHILNPKTGWPVMNGPRSVTVAAATCTEAGILSTLAMLQGNKAESFLKKQKIKYWCYR
jgi:FAD:protein FMN transferase